MNFIQDIISNENMMKPETRVRVEASSNWLQLLRDKGDNSYYIASGHAWLRFHRWAFIRFPTQDIAAVDRKERREMFFKAKALAISHQQLPDANETANAILYLCRDKDYDISKLSANNRSKVRRGQKRMEVRRATRREVAENGYPCYYDTCTRQGIVSISESEFQAKWQKGDEPSQEIWAAFADNEIAALGMVSLCGKWAELLYTQSANKYLKDYSNHALFYTVLRDLLHREEIESVSYGLSSVQQNSKIDSLHQFKLSVNFEAVPVVRKIHANPFLRIAFNQTTLAGTRQLERIFPKARHVLAARGAFELMMDTNGVTPSAGDRDDALRSIEPRDAKSVAVLHREIFPDYSSTQLGLHFCAELYRSYATTDGAFGFVIWRGGECVGFVVGGTHDTHNQINRKLRAKAAAAILWRPVLVVKTGFGKLSKFFPKAKSELKISTPDGKKIDRSRAAKLILIGVKEIARGTGAAAELMQAFRSEAARRGFETVTLIVTRDNQRARAAYEKAGWTLIDKGGESVEYYIAASSTNAPEFDKS